ncbi:50S ribosomal protein L10 [Alphaproteobacteria bacterium]|nr:50S ribosomal protein L10 [Alphaproteobacteria bacterium]
MNRNEKTALVGSLGSAFAEASIVIATAPKGLTVAETEALRRRVKASGTAYKVAKNRLATLALGKSAFANLTALMKGPTALAYGSDPVAAAKAIASYAKENEKLAVLGAVMDGRLMSASEVMLLATLPSLDELRGKLAGLTAAPATKLACVAQAPAAQLARVFSAYGKKAA